MHTPPQLTELKARLREIDDLEMAAALLNWDQTTYMPPGGAAARGRQLATLGRIIHEKRIDPAIGRLLDALRSYEESLPPDSPDAALIRVTRRDYERAMRVPAAFTAELYEHTAASYDVWSRARPANDFMAVLPYLERTLDLSRRFAEFFPGYEHIADPLIDMADYGMRAATIKQVFAELRQGLIPLVEQITVQPPVDDSCLRQFFPEAQQWAFGVEVITALGYDFSRGRQDKTLHPFMTKFSLNDVRITTRVDEYDLGSALFSTIHEAGHAMYEQGIAQAFEGTPLASGTSAGMHESQSRLWENIVGRSLPFWEYFYPRLQATFPDQLGNVPLETFYRAINKVQRSLIRTEADEVTYNLHVILRFDLELALLEGTLAVRDLPEAWRERYRSDLGVAPPDDRDGVLQDVHWYGGLIGGAFQGYTLGNIMSVQLFDAALRDHPDIPQQIGSGRFDTLREWMREHVYRHGRALDADDILRRATGRSLDVQPYLAYLWRKYG
ncbi:carboxypeptidase M32 [Roseiflexus castenholzii]|jgi:carboxypeptidase Taq|uniref:Metal-dependent carboxypeptidase n=2 Tax=Roseiflexus TaxID=120961 RepID=A7NLJ8_ROSCS|nr:carboxypeptidase M32 [Roseiflexus castenholzii]ABU58389.1 Carboxypeptidase Taq [Roseiflexus castenholzii DSM 13941]